MWHSRLNRGLLTAGGILFSAVLLRMAPKATTVQALQLENARLHKQLAAGGKGVVWDCSVCGLEANYWDRHFCRGKGCMGCRPDLPAGTVRPKLRATSTAPAQRAQGAPALPAPKPRVRATSRQKPALKVASPPQGEAQGDPELEEAADPVAKELAEARRIKAWAEGAPESVRQEVLPQAQARLRAAEEADRARKPLGEQLRSAQDRADHRRRTFLAADAEAVAANDAFTKAVAARTAAEGEWRASCQELEAVQDLMEAQRRQRVPQGATQAFQGDKLEAARELHRLLAPALTPKSREQTLLHTILGVQLGDPPAAAGWTTPVPTEVAEPDETMPTPGEASRMQAGAKGSGGGAEGWAGGRDRSSSERKARRREEAQPYARPAKPSGEVAESEVEEVPVPTELVESD